MSISVRVSTPVPIWGEVPSPENVTRFHERWNKENLSYTKLPAARWVEMACTSPLLAVRMAIKSGMTDEIKGEMVVTHMAMQEDFKGRIADALQACSETFNHQHPDYIGSVNLEKSVVDRLSEEVLRDARWKGEYAALERRLRDWLMDHQAEAGVWLDRSLPFPPPTVVSHSFPG